jgi:hypothetical protein
LPPADSAPIVLPGCKCRETAPQRVLENVTSPTLRR